MNFLQEYVLLHGIPRTIRLDQARCQTGQQVKTFCSQNKIQLIKIPIHDHRAIGLVERLIQTIKNRLARIKTAARNQFNVKASINSIIHSSEYAVKRLSIYRHLRHILVERRILH